MIANPYLLKKNQKNNKNKKIDRLENQNLLYKYLENRYQNEYISPKQYYNIISSIDEIIYNYIIKDILEEIIMQIEIKFDCLNKFKSKK